MLFRSGRKTERKVSRFVCVREREVGKETEMREKERDIYCPSSTVGSKGEVGGVEGRRYADDTERRSLIGWRSSGGALMGKVVRVLKHGRGGAGRGQERGKTGSHRSARVG